MIEVEIGNKTKRRLSKLPVKQRRQVLERIMDLKTKPHPSNSGELEVLDGYRIVEDEVIELKGLGHDDLAAGEGQELSGQVLGTLNCPDLGQKGHDRDCSGRSCWSWM